MTRIPPLLPEEILLRVIRIARMDGIMILAIAGFFAILAALGGDRVGALTGLLVAGAGALELHGTGLLETGERRGMRWLIGSQLFLLAVIVSYCAFRLANVDLALLQDALTDERRTQILATGWQIDEFLLFAYRTTYRVVAGVSIAYQGGMALYYFTRRDAVNRALDAG